MAYTSKYAEDQLSKNGGGRKEETPKRKTAAYGALSRPGPVTDKTRTERDKEREAHFERKKKRANSMVKGTTLGYPAVKSKEAARHKKIGHTRLKFK
jgi:hypothetical protein